MKRLTFNPKSLGKTEKGWWKAHNEKDKQLMIDLLIKNYTQLYSLRSQNIKTLLPYLAKALDGHDRKVWKIAFSEMENFYRNLKDLTKLQLDPKKASLLEVGWWKLHDNLEFKANKIPLANLFTELYSEIFMVDKKLLKDAGILRAWATYEHDLAEDPHTPKELVARHWKNAEVLLIDFYAELKKAVNHS